MKDLLVTRGASEEEAVESVRQTWKAQHQKELDEWNAFLQQAQGGEERVRAEAAPTGLVPGPAQEEVDWQSRPTPSFLDLQPARHILKKLEKKEFVEIWHFTAQGCREAAVIDASNPEDRYCLVGAEKGIQIQAFGTSAVSEKVIKDEFLPWSLLTEGKTRLILSMKTCGWSKEEAAELIKFYVNLDTHWIRSEDYGLETVMRYQERVRCHWTRSVKNGMPYAVGTINDTLMSEYQRQIGIEIQARNNVSASN